MTDTERDTPTLEVSSGGDLNAGAVGVLEAAIRERDEMLAEIARLRATVERVEKLCDEAVTKPLVTSDYATRTYAICKEFADQIRAALTEGSERPMTSRAVNP